MHMSERGSIQQQNGMIKIPNYNSSIVCFRLQLGHYCYNGSVSLLIFLPRIDITVRYMHVLSLCDPSSIANIIIQTLFLQIANFALLALTSAVRRKCIVRATVGFTVFLQVSQSLHSFCVYIICSSY